LTDWLNFFIQWPWILPDSVWIWIVYAFMTESKRRKNCCKMESTGTKKTINDRILVDKFCVANFLFIPSVSGLQQWQLLRKSWKWIGLVVALVSSSPFLQCWTLLLGRAIVCVWLDISQALRTTESLSVCGIDSCLLRPPNEAPSTLCHDEQRPGIDQIELVIVDSTYGRRIIINRRLPVVYQSETDMSAVCWVICGLKQQFLGRFNPPP